jgi:Fe(3+) dicitrate transport protein
MRRLHKAVSLAALVTACPVATQALAAAPADPTRLAAAGPDTAVYQGPHVEVVGRRDNLRRIPGSASVLDARSLSRSRVLSANEALRKLPGLAVRDEEGFGLRPNSGIRGLNPTRSTKVTLLEDGIPLAYAPYGDNANYYHPPIERYESIELLKGAGQVLFGPQTIGGLVNYITPAPPARPAGALSSARGNRDYSAARVRLGGYRALLDYSRKAGDGARDHVASALDDLNLKAVVTPALVLRASVFRERSNVTYSGLTQAEFERRGPRYNPFEHDRFDLDRVGGSATHRQPLGRGALLTTSVYASRFARDWWRQSSTTTDAQGGPGVAAARLAGDALDADTIRSVQGRLREYVTWGIEPRLRWTYPIGRASAELTAGAKAHLERQDRRQVNGTTAHARTGAIVEDNLRRTRAGSAFLAHRVEFGRWSVTPGVRFEHIRSERTNRLPGGARGSDALSRWIPGIGATCALARSVMAFAGVHGGFAPPRTEDVITGSGTATDVGPEESVNWEIGARLDPAPGAEVQVAAFRNEFRRLIAVGSVAGGSTPLAEGEALFMGGEIAARLRHPGGAYVRVAWSWLPVAEQTTAFRQVLGGAVVAGSAAGLRQPYAPENAVTAGVGLEWRGLDGLVEMAHSGAQSADFANTLAPSADGQHGGLAAHTIWNATLNARLGATGATAFASVKNLEDRVYIVDRTRGILPGAPRTALLGLSYAFGDRR